MRFALTLSLIYWLFADVKMVTISVKIAELRAVKKKTSKSSLMIAQTAWKCVISFQNGEVFKYGPKTSISKTICFSLVILKSFYPTLYRQIEESENFIKFRLLQVQSEWWYSFHVHVYSSLLGWVWQPTDLNFPRRSWLSSDPPTPLQTARTDRVIKELIN